MKQIAITNQLSSSSNEGSVPAIIGGKAYVTDFGKFFDNHSQEEVDEYLRATLSGPKT